MIKSLQQIFSTWMEGNSLVVYGFLQEVPVMQSLPLILVWINSWKSNPDAIDLRRPNTQM